MTAFRIVSAWKGDDFIPTLRAHYFWAKAAQVFHRSYHEPFLMYVYEL